MSSAKKLESMLEFVVSDVREIISANFEQASRYVASNGALKDIVVLFEFMAKNPESYLHPVLNGAVISDVLWVVCQSVLADDEVETEELERVASLLQDSIHRYCWIEDYEKFKCLSDASDAVDLLAQWQKDGGWFGGDRVNGAILHPFNDFVLLACVIAGSASLFQTYSKALFLIAKLILESEGVTAGEQAFYDSLNGTLQRSEAIIADMLPMPVRSNLIGGLATHDISSEARSNLNAEDALREGMQELNALVGIDSVKAEVTRLTNFLKIRQQRLDQGMPVPSQSLHFVFTGNPGTGKTTVARIIAKILYGFRILKTSNLIEADRATMVGGYVGQTAIKSSEVIAKATNGVLFIDEAYTLAKSGGEDYGREAIDTLLKKMEDLRDKLVVIVAGYPDEMASFVRSNPGLESRFTRYIKFDDYHVSELCQIFEKMCGLNAYQLTQQARGNLAVVLNRAFVNRDRNFGNARFVRNAYERTLGNHSDRLATSNKQITREALSTIEAEDLPFDLADGINSPLDLESSRWTVQCPQCEKVSSARLPLIGQFVKCKCGTRFRCPWWNLEKETVNGLVWFEEFERPIDVLGYDVQTPKST